MAVHGRSGWNIPRIRVDSFTLLFTQSWSSPKAQSAWHAVPLSPLRRKRYLLGKLLLPPLPPLCTADLCLYGTAALPLPVWPPFLTCCRPLLLGLSALAPSSSSWGALMPRATSKSSCIRHDIPESVTAGLNNLSTMPEVAGGPCGASADAQATRLRMEHHDTLMHCATQHFSQFLMPSTIATLSAKTSHYGTCGALRNLASHSHEMKVSEGKKMRMHA